MSSRDHYTANEKKMLPGVRLSGFLLLFTGEDSRSRLKNKGGLPLPLYTHIAPALQGEAMTVRDLRERLCAMCLYLDLTPEEIDRAFGYAHCGKFTEPQNPAEKALLLTVRKVHQYWPEYAYSFLYRAVEHLSDAAFDPELLALYRQQLPVAEARANHADALRKSARDRFFERHYTADVGRGVLDFAADMMTALVAAGVLTEKETKTLRSSLSRRPIPGVL